MKPHGFVWVVKRWCSVCIDPVRRYFDNLEGPNNRHFPIRCGPIVCELAIGLRLSTIVSSQDLSGVWITISE
jgi:hypothetical protein